jgi:preprotein translocase subunit YajC
MAGSWISVLAEGEAPSLFSGQFGAIVPFLVIGMLFYLLLIRPERRKKQEMDRMLDNLNKNDQIVTVGGIWGVVVNTAKGSEYITIRVDEESNAKLRVLRSAVSRVISGDKPDKPKDASA